VNQASSPSYSTPPSSLSGPQLGQPVSPAALQGPGGGYGIDPKTGLAYSHRSKVVAGVLQLCLGGFGVGRFYTGHVGIAIAQIAVTIFTCGFGVLWPLIDGIMILVGESPRDVDGRPLRPG
jgi:TM2 domain-containing membrane protein YozV